MNIVKAFIFDLDGVITETSKEHYKAWKILANEHGMDFDISFNENLKGVSRLESLERILVHCGRENDFSDDEKKILANTKNEIYKDMIGNITEDDLFHGILDLIIELKNRKIKIAVASASKNAPTIIKRLGIGKYLDYIVNPAEIKNGKPAPDIFLKAAKELGVSPKDCIGIEDAEVGIEAINRANMFSVGVGEYSKMNEAHVIFSSPEKLNFQEILKAYTRWKSL